MRRERAVIVGAGPAGLAAAVELARRGERPLVIDENPLPGGQIHKKPAGNVDPSAVALPLASYRMGRALLEEANAHRERIEHITGACVTGVFENLEVVYTRGGPAEAVRAETLLLAPGAHDRVVPFPGWTLPGVITAGGLQDLLKHHGILPGRRIVLAGAGPLTLLVAAQLCAAGHPPAALVEATGPWDLAPALPGLLAWFRMLTEGARLVGLLRKAGVPLLRRRAAVRALGESQVEAVEICPLDADWRPEFARKEWIETDCLAVGFGLVPETALARLAGADLVHDEALGGWAPRHDETMETARKGVFVAGDGAGVRGAEIAQLQGRLAGLAMAVRLGTPGGAMPPEAKALRATITRRVRARAGLDRAFRVRPGIYETVTPETLVCRCEEIDWAEACEWIDRGANSPTRLKMATRIGMGRCQGRFCGPSLRGLLRRRLGGAADLDEGLSARPPVRPVPLGALANMEDD